MSPSDVLNIPMEANDAEALTVGDYLKTLLLAVWDKEERFSGKRPFGNSGWQDDLYKPVIQAGGSTGSLDLDGEVLSIGDADLLVRNAIAVAFEATATVDAEGVLRAFRNLTHATLCKDCGGWGVKVYGNTATWHPAFIAGSAMTPDVCDKCWGSGNANEPWPSHRLLTDADPPDAPVAKPFDASVEAYEQASLKSEMLREAIESNRSRPKRSASSQPEREWLGWKTESEDAIGDALNAVHQGHADIAVQCLARAMIVLRAQRR